MKLILPLKNLACQTWEGDHFRQEIMVAAEGVAVMAEMMICYGNEVLQLTDIENWVKSIEAIG